MDHETRARLIEFVAELDKSDESIFAHIRRWTPATPDSRHVPLLVVIDSVGNEIARIPQKDVDMSDPYSSIVALIGIDCVSCGVRLLDTEGAICALCESRDVMGLLRIWDSTR